MRVLVLVLSVFLTLGDVVLSQEKIRSHQFDGVVWALAIASNGERYGMALSFSGKILVVQRDNGRTVVRLQAKHAHTRALQFTADASMVAYGVLDTDADQIPFMAVRVARISDPQKVAKFDFIIPDADVLTLRFSATNEYLGGILADRTMRVWKLRNKALVINSDEDIDRIAFSPDGKYIATAGEKKLCRWDLETNKLSKEGELKDKGMDIRFVGKGKELVVGTFPGEFEVWPATLGRRKHIIEIPDLRIPVDRLVLSPDATKAAVVYKGEILVFDLATKKITALLSHSKGYDVTDMAFSGNGEFLLSSATNILPKQHSEVTLWGFSDNKEDKKHKK